MSASATQGGHKEFSLNTRAVVYCTKHIPSKRLNHDTVTHVVLYTVVRQRILNAVTFPLRASLSH